MSQNLHDKIKDLVERTAAFMGVACQVALTPPAAPDGALQVVVRTEADANLLIGKNGQNLAALEHVVRAVAARHGGDRRIVVDVNDYRQERAEQVVQMVRQVVARVRDTRRAQALLPMAPHERRIVHMELASYTDVTSESVGIEPHRKVVIKPLAF